MILQGVDACIIKAMVTKLTEKLLIICVKHFTELFSSFFSSHSLSFCSLGTRSAHGLGHHANADSCAQFGWTLFGYCKKHVISFFVYSIPCYHPFFRENGIPGALQTHTGLDVMNECAGLVLTNAGLISCTGVTGR